MPEVVKLLAAVTTRGSHSKINFSVVGRKNGKDVCFKGTYYSFRLKGIRKAKICVPAVFNDN